MGSHISELKQGLQVISDLEEVTETTLEVIFLDPNSTVTLASMLFEEDSTEPLSRNGKSSAE